MSRVPRLTLSQQLEALAQVWRDRATMLRAHGAEQSAKTAEFLADELDFTVTEAMGETLKAGEAAIETGYSRESITRLVRNGTLPNAGRPKAPRVRRGDLSVLNGARAPRNQADDASLLPSTARQMIASKTRIR
jgi:hypothetical protein